MDIVVLDGAGGWDTTSVTIHVAETNDDPILGFLDDLTVNEHDTATFTATASDADVPIQALTFSLDAGAPAGAAIDPVTGDFTWTPGEADGPGDYTFAVVVTDEAGAGDSQDVTVTVLEVNETPILDPIGDLTVNEHATAAFTATASDVDIPAQTLTYSLGANAPAGAAIDPDSGAFTWTPGEADGPGMYTFEVRVTDDGGLFDVTDVTVTVSEVNEHPVLDAVPDLYVNEHETATFTATATDVDLPAQTLTFFLGGAPSGSVLDPNSGEFTWTPGEADGGGIFMVDVVVADGAGGWDTTSVTIHVAETNDDPTLGFLDDLTVNEHDTATFTATASDGDVPIQALTFSLGAGAPAGAAIDPVTGDFTWTPGEADGPGDYTFAVVVTDEAGGSDSQDVTVTVLEVNEAPILDPIGDLTVNEHETAAFTATASDGDIPAQTLTYSLGANAPAGAAIDPDSGEFTWTPGEADGPGMHTFEVRVTDDGGLSDSTNVTVTVLEVNEDPILDFIPELFVDEHQTAVFTATATDVDLPVQALAFSLGGNVPTGATIDPTTGEFTWTPGETDGPGDFTFEVVVTDELGGSDFQQITIHVAEVNVPPVLDPIAEVHIDEHETATFTATATDADVPRQNLTYTLDGGNPLGAAIDPVTGEFTWTTDESHGPDDYVFTVIATDDDGAFGSVDVTIHVAEVNEAPILDPISDVTVNENEPVTLTATAIDADLPGQELTFDLGPGSPAGAAIDPVTGEFTWTPGEADGGSNFTIEVTVTDTYGGSDSVEFTVEVLDVNENPILDPVPEITANEHETAAFTATATDIDLPVQTLTFSLAGAPAAATIDPATGEFSWITTEADGPNDYTFQVIVTDDLGGSDSVDVTVHVLETDEPPVVDPISEITVDEGDTAVFTATASDPDLPVQKLTFSLGAAAPADATIDPVTGAFTWITTEADGPGSYTFAVTVTDETGLSGSVDVTIHVEEVNQPPVIDPIAAQTVDEFDTVTFTAAATDADVPNQGLTFSLGPGAPAAATIDPASGDFTWITGETDGPGDHTFQVIVTDAYGASDAVDVTVTVLEVNAPPTLDPIPEVTVDELQTASFTATAVDVDFPAQTLVFSLGAGAPAAAAIDSVTGEFTWATTEADGPGDFTFPIVVTDALGGSDSVDVTIHVVEVDEAPVLDPIAEITVDEGDPATFTATATDPDLPVQTLTFGLGAGAPAAATIDPVTGEFTWVPGEADGPGDFTFTVTVTDETGLSDSVDVTIHVEEVDTAPVIDPIPDVFANEHATATFTATATDTDLPVQTLTFSLGAGAPASAAIDPSSGVFTWIPGEVDGPGDYMFTVTVTDTTGLSDTTDVMIHVYEVNEPPVIDPIVDVTVNEYETAAFTATATDADLPAQALTFGLGANAPAGATIDPDSGQFLWIPGEIHGGHDYTFDVIVTDSWGDHDLTAVTIHVEETNWAPELKEIVDRNVFVGYEAVFTAEATDRDIPIQAIAYSLGAGAPAFAVIDSSTGEFRWIPLGDDLGKTYTFDVIATDSVGADDSQTVSLTVVAANGQTEYIVTSSGDNIDHDGVVTLREAILAACTNEPVGDAPGGSEEETETITFDPGVFASDPIIDLELGGLYVTADLNIVGLGPDDLTVDAGGNSRILAVAADVTADISGMRFTGGSAFDGGAVFNAGALTLDDMVISGNHGHRGGAICNHLGPLTIRNSVISDNWAVSGGAICSHDGDLTLVGTELSHNTAEKNGGAILLENDGTAHLAGVVLTDNVAGQNGGGIANTHGRLELTNVLMQGNLAEYNGGAVHNESGNLVVRNSTIAGNTASPGGTIESFGGGIHNGSGSLEISQSIVAFNEADVEPDVYGFAPNLVFDDAVVGDTLFRMIGDMLLTGTIDPDTLFVGDALTTTDPLSDLRLGADSPAVDAADASELPADLYDLNGNGDYEEPLPIDLDKNPRVRGGALDLGALESEWESDAVDAVTMLIEGDLDGDGRVGSADLDVVRGNWGAGVKAKSRLLGDANGDGKVGSDDLDVVRANWGAHWAAAADALFDDLGKDDDSEDSGDGSL